MISSSLPALPAATGVAWFLVAISAVMVAVHPVLLALAAARADVSARVRLVLPLTAGFLLALWFAWALLAVPQGVVIPEPDPLAGRAVQRPELLVEMAAFVLLGAAALFASPALRRVNAAMPPSWLIAIQVYRVAGLVFLWPFLAAGAVPAGFAVPAGIGDALTGVAAPFVAWAVARRRPGATGLALAWNWFGIVDLIVAPVAAVLTQSTNIGRFPLVVVPLFLGPPLGILTHLYSLRNLRAHRLAAAGGNYGK